MAEKEYLTERIKYFGDLLKLSCVFLIAIGSGTISLFLSELTQLKIVLATAGMTLIIGFVIACWRIDRHLKALLESLRKV